MSAPRLVMVTGQRRSGTTLLANLLDAQPHVTVLRDFLGIARLHRRTGHLPLTEAVPADRRSEVRQAFLRQNHRLGLSTKATGHLDGLVPDERDPWSLGQLYQRVLEGIAAPGDVVVGHKTTSAEPVVEELLDAVPRLGVVYAVRDPRSVVISARAKFPEESTLSLVDGWLAGVTHMLDLMRRRPDLVDRVTWIRFEDLVSAPQPSVDALSVLLGGEGWRVPPDLADYGSDWSNNSSFALSGGTIDATTSARSHTDPALARTVEVAIAPWIEILGWERPAPVTRSERLGHLGRTAVERGRRLADRGRAGVARRLSGRSAPEPASR